jgi:hypothetical protein
MVSKFRSYVTNLPIVAYGTATGTDIKKGPFLIAGTSTGIAFTQNNNLYLAFFMHKK